MTRPWGLLWVASDDPGTASHRRPLLRPRNTSALSPYRPLAGAWWLADALQPADRWHAPWYGDTPLLVVLLTEALRPARRLGQRAATMWRLATGRGVEWQNRRCRVKALLLVAVVPARWYEPSYQGQPHHDEVGFWDVYSAGPWDDSGVATAVSVPTGWRLGRPHIYRGN